MRKNYNRNFKIEGLEFKIIDICDFDYKYRIDVFSKDSQTWVTIKKCNTLTEGKQKAYDYIDFKNYMESQILL